MTGMSEKELFEALAAIPTPVKVNRKQEVWAAVIISAVILAIFLGTVFLG
jgi:hypothetical protein